MPTKLLIDGMLSGTGIRDAIDGGYVEPGAVGLSEQLVRELAVWQKKYEEAHFARFPADMISQLDEEGAMLASRANAELSDIEIGYFSNGL